jgi:hypothetical protein
MSASSATKPTRVCLLIIGVTTNFEVASAGLDLRTRCRRKILHAGTLIVRVCMEEKHALAGELAGVELRQLLADIGFDRFQQRAQALVQVDDLAVGRDDHHVAGDAVDGAFDPGHLRPRTRIGLDGARHAADLVLLLGGGDLNPVLVIGEPGHGVLDARERWQQRPRRRQGEQNDDKRAGA